MLKILLLAMSIGLILVACESQPEAKKPTADPKQANEVDQEWHPSTLSEQTIAKANSAVMDYRTCLAKETNARGADRGDPRDIANTILRNCENKLPAIKAAFDAENVPAAISERYLRKTRSHGVQSVMRTVTGIHAERAGEEEAAANPATKK